MADPKQCWQYCHSCIVESLWKPRLTVIIIYWSNRKSQNLLKFLQGVTESLYIYYSFEFWVYRWQPYQSKRFASENGFAGFMVPNFTCGCHAVLSSRIDPLLRTAFQDFCTQPRYSTVLTDSVTVCNGHQKDITQCFHCVCALTTGCEILSVRMVEYQVW